MPGGPTQVPPMLTADGVLVFRNPGHLAAWLELEIARGRLLAVDLLGLPQFERRSLRLRVEGAGEVEIWAQSVHRQADLVGLALELDPALLSRLRRLCPVEAALRPGGSAAAPIPASGAPGGGVGSPAAGASATPIPGSGAPGGGVGSRPAGASAATPLPAGGRPASSPAAGASATPIPASGRAAGSPAAGASAATPLPATGRPAGSPAAGASATPLPASGRGVGSPPAGASAATPLPASGRSVGSPPAGASAATPLPASGRGVGSPPAGASAATPLPASGAPGGGGLPSASAPPDAAQDRAGPHDLGSLGLEGLTIEDTGGLLLGPEETPQPLFGPTRAPEPIQEGPLRAVRGLEILGAGSQTTLLSLLARLVRGDASGRLQVHGPGGTWVLDLAAHGFVADFGGDLGPALVSAGVLGTDDVAGLAEAGRTAAQARRIRAAHRDVSTGALRTALRTVLAERLDSVGSAGPLRFSFDPNESVPERGELLVPFLDVAPAWLDRVMSEVRLDALEAHYHQLMFAYPVVHEAPPAWSPALMALDRVTRRVVEESLASGRPLRDLLTFSPLGRVRTLRFLALLDALDMVRFLREPPSDAPPSDAIAELRARQSDALRDHFRALGVHFSTHPDGYAEALARAEKKYGPEGERARLSPEAKQICADIVEKARAAARFLKEPAARARHRVERYDPSQLRGAVDLMARQLRLARFRGQTVFSRELEEMVREIAASMHIEPD